MKACRFFFTLVFVLVHGLAADAGPAQRPQSNTVWSSLYSENILAYATNLRAAGCPEPTVGLLISQEINQRFAERERALQPSLLSLQSLRDEFTPEHRAALLQLRLEKNAAFRSAIGHAPQDSTNFSWTAGGLARLTAQERDLVSVIMGDYDAMIASVLVDSRGHLMDDDREKLRFLESQRDVDLGKLLTPDEILDFNVIATVYGRTVRAELSLFEPTQEQLRAYLALGKKHGLDYEIGVLNPTRHNEERAALNADLAKIWDAETYPRYRGTISAHYGHIYLLVRRLNLPRSVADEIFASQKTTTESGYDIYKSMRMISPTQPPPLPGTEQVMWPNKYPPNDVRSVMINDVIKIAADHCDFVRSKLGDAGFNEYFELNRRWLEAMRIGGAARLDYSSP